MRIAYLCASYLAHRGGAELYVHRLAGELVRLGHELTIISAEGPLPPFPDAPYQVTALQRHRRREQIVQRLLALENVRGCYRLAQWLFRSGYHRLLAMGPCCPELENPRLYADFDVVALIHGGSAWSVQASRLLGRLPGRLTVAVPLLHVRESSAALPVLRRIFSGYQLILTLSDYESAWMKDRGWGGSRIFSVGAGSDDDRHSVTAGEFRKRHGIPAQAPLVAYVGRKIYNKGVLHVIEAMDRVWEREPRACLVLLGFSHNPPEWIQGAIARMRHAAGGRILNLDDVSELEREQALEDCDVFCMPSISDSFGIAYLDAWRHRKPVIGCRGCCAESIIDHGRTGLLVEFGNVGEIATALETLMANEPVRTAMGAAGFLEWKQKWTWDLIAKRTEKIFQDHLPQNPGRTGGRPDRGWPRAQGGAESGTALCRL